jgi:predicted dienelactone hydrolase
LRLGSLEATVKLGTHWAFAVIRGCLGFQAQAAGIQLLDTDPNLAGAIWHPCAREPEHVSLGGLAVTADFGLMGARDCPVAKTKLPLVIFSHGNTGWFGQHHDTVVALADAGFVVAAINHPGDNASDTSQSGKMSVWASRPADIVRLVDFLLHDWKDRAVIDPDRLGLFGFSVGAYTGLVVAGAEPDFRRQTLRCSETDNSDNCERACRGDVPSSPPHDPRIRAAVLADPALNALFTRQALSGIHIPLQFWRSELGGHGVEAKFTALTASQARPTCILSRPVTTPSWHHARRSLPRPSRAFAPKSRRASTGQPFTASSTPTLSGSFARISPAPAEFAEFNAKEKCRFGEPKRHGSLNPEQPQLREAPLSQSNPAPRAHLYLAPSTSTGSSVE